MSVENLNISAPELRSKGNFTAESGKPDVGSTTQIFNMTAFYTTQL